MQKSIPVSYFSNVILLYFWSSSFLGIGNWTDIAKYFDFSNDKIETTQSVLVNNITLSSPKVGSCIDHSMGDLAAGSAHVFAAEICNNGIDDDGDGLIDCWDDDCQPTLGNDTTICLGDFLILDAMVPSDPGTINYQWQSHGGYGNPYTINPITKDTFTLRVNGAGYGCSFRDEIIVDVEGLIIGSVVVSDCYDSNGATIGGNSVVDVRVMVDFITPTTADVIEVSVPGASPQNFNTTVSSPQLLTFTVPADGASGNVTASFQNNVTVCPDSEAFTVPNGDCVETPCTNTGGSVFLDSDNDGVRAATETKGISKVNVTVDWDDCTGNTGSFSTSTDYKGQFDFPSVPNGAKVRISFTNIPSDFSCTCGEIILEGTAPDCTFDLGVVDCHDAASPAWLKKGYSVVSCLPGADKVVLASKDITTLGTLWDTPSNRGVNRESHVSTEGMWTADQFDDYDVNPIVIDQRTGTIYVGTSSLVAEQQHTGGRIMDTLTYPVIYRITADDPSPKRFAMMPGRLGVGDLEIDYAHNQIFATNVDDGKIYRFDVETGAQIGNAYDPLMADDGVLFQIPPLGDAILGIGYNDTENKIYYGVWSNMAKLDAGYKAENNTLNSVRSVSLDANGAIQSATDAKEFDIPLVLDPTTQLYTYPVGSIEFNEADDKVLLAEMQLTKVYGNKIYYNSSTHTGRLLEYQKSGASWTLAPLFPGNYNSKYDIGNQSSYEGMNTRGGVEWAYKSIEDGKIVGDEEFILATGDALVSSASGYGYQFTPSTGGDRSNSVLINLGNPSGAKYTFNDVEIYKGIPCHEVEIAGVIEEDDNNDGIQQLCETPIPNVDVKLFDGSCQLVYQTTTDTDGKYKFSNLDPNTEYRIVAGDGNYTDDYLSVNGNEYFLTLKDKGGNDDYDSDGILGVACGGLDVLPYAVVTTGNLGCECSNVGFRFAPCDEDIDPGTISGNEDGCGSYNPTEISNSASASDGNSVSYQWQTSPDGVMWFDFASATLETFDPPTISQTTHYRRGARYAECSNFVYSNVIVKTVISNFTNGGQVTGDESECGGYDPGLITVVSSPTGGVGGTTTYQWQSRISGGGWTNIASGTNPALNPTAITQTTEYRRGARRATCTNLVFSNIVTKEVLGGTTANIATYPTGNLCSNTDYDFAAQNSGSGVIYYWDFGIYASSVNSTGIGPHQISFDVPKTSTSTTIEVELVVGIGACELRDTVDIVVLAGIDTTSIIKTDPTSCNAPDGSITINADYYNGNNIEVSLDNGSSWETANQLTFNNLTAGSYDIQIRYVGQTCIYDFGRVTLSDISVVASGILEDYDLECDDLTHSFSATADATINTYSWNFGSGASPATATGAGPHNITYSTYGSKTVSLTTSQNGCNTVYSEPFELIQNVTDAGEIAEDQFLCGSNDPDPLTNISNATGGTGGTISYQWQRRTKATPFIWGNWGNIPGETGLSYDPPVLTEETQYRRMASRTSCVGVPTNVISVTPSSEPDANINNFASVCPGQAYSNDVSTNDNNVLSPSYSVYTNGQNGSVNIFDDGSFIYEPNTLFCGTDKFVYEVCNHAGTCCDTATVNLDLTDPAAPVLYNIPAPEFIHCDEDVPTPPFVLALENCLQVELGMDEVSTQGLSSCELHTYDITRVWTATDYCGLSANSSQTIMVEDITAPGIYRVYTLPNGTKMIGGFVDHVGERWKHITLPITFATKPVIFTQIITENDASATSVQLKNVSKSQFDIRLMDEEANDAVVHGRERIAWIAMEQGNGTLNNPFEVSELPVDSNPKVINFSQAFTTNPVLIANTQTAYSSEPVEVRIPNLNSSNASIYLQEDQSADLETTHSIEGVGYVAFDKKGNLELPSGEIFGETGKASFPGNIWKEIPLSHGYKNPIVVATISTENDSEPVAVRIKDVTPSSFYMKIDGWDYQTNTHGTEEISYVVIEGSVPFDQTVACDATPATLQVGTEIITVDNCDVAVNIEYSETPNTNNCAPGNIITRSWYSEDECGNSVSYSRQISVFDNIDPEFTVPADVTIECEDNINDLTLTGDVTDESDNCATGIEAIYVDLYTGSFVCDSSFTVVREWTLHDNCGNSVTKHQNINVIHRGVYLSAKLLLQGALFNSTDTLMTDDLRVQGLLPLVEPYTEMSAYHHIGGGGESVFPSVFTVTGPDAIVDWVFIELRNSLKNDSIVATRSGLIQRDGDIVDVDGISPIEFDNAQPGQYNIAVRHRNHLGAMTLYPKRLKTDPTDESTFDFTVEPEVSAANVLTAIDFDKDGLVYLCDRGGTVPNTIQVPVDSVGGYAQNSSFTCGPCGQYKTINDGDWGDPSVWENGNIPPMPVGTGTEVVINHELSNPGYFEINGEGMVWIEKGSLLAEDDLKVYDSGKLFILDSDVETNGFFYLNSSPVEEPRLVVVGSRFTVRTSYHNDGGFAFFKNACVTAEQGYEIIGQERYEDAQIDVLSGSYKVFNTQNSVRANNSKFHIQSGDLENHGQFKGSGAYIWIPSGNLINYGSWEHAIGYLCVDGTISASIPQNAIPVVQSCNEMPILFNEFICGNVIDQLREEQVVSNPDSPVVKPWGTFAMVATTQGQALWSGDYNADRQTIYQGPSNDVSHLFVQVLTDPDNIEALPNYIRIAYDEADIDLNGKVIYQGPDNERSKLLFRTILIMPGNVQLLPNFIISEQIPR